MLATLVHEKKRVRNTNDIFFLIVVVVTVGFEEVSLVSFENVIMLKEFISINLINFFC